MGTRVEGNYMGSGQWYKGVITAASRMAGMTSSTTTTRWSGEGRVARVKRASNRMEQKAQAKPRKRPKGRRRKRRRPR